MLTLGKLEEIETKIKKLKEIISNCDGQDAYTKQGIHINRLLVDSLIIHQPPSDLVGEVLPSRDRINWVSQYPNLYSSLFMYIKYNKLPRHSVVAILNNAYRRGYTFEDMSLRKQKHALTNETIIALYIDSEDGKSAKGWENPSTRLGPVKVSFSRRQPLPYTLTFKETNND